MLSPLIIALDTQTDLDAIKLVEQTGDHVDIYKIGPGLFYKYGRGITDKIRKLGKKVFLDLKLHDIPNTVELAVNLLEDLNIYSLTIHLSGGEDMLKRALSAKSRPKIWGVSVLTSFDDSQLKTLGINGGVKNQVKRLVEIGLKNNIDGIVLSPLELEDAAELRSKYRADTKFITPGIRLEDSDIKSEDQKRTSTPKKARERGADFLVIGRPVIKSEDPKKTVEQIIKALKE